MYCIWLLLDKVMPVGRRNADEAIGKQEGDSDCFVTLYVKEDGVSTIQDSFISRCWR